MVKFYLLFVLFIYSSFLTAQDRLVPLSENLQLQKDYQQLMNSPSSRAAENQSYYFELDTLELPFIDDFSRNTLKTFQFDSNDPGITQNFWHKFTVDGFINDTLQVYTDTSYQYVWNSGTSTWDSLANGTIEVIYNDSIYRAENIPVDTVLFWPRPDSILVNDTLVENTNFGFFRLNEFDTVNIIPDDGQSLWVGNDGWINPTMPDDPITLGVLTLDGVDSAGIPHDPNSVTSSYGISDVVTSKPIFLGTKPQGGFYTTLDSIYFTFFYQPAGLGDAPEERDSLILEFYLPDEDRWVRMWSSEGGDNKPFEEVAISFRTLDQFLQDGFRFRFLNYATLTGAFDNWHIDYVRLGANRSSDDLEIDDLAYLEEGKTLLSRYTQMPWEHYWQSSQFWMIDQSEMFIRNNSNTAKNVESVLEVYDGDTRIFQSDIRRKPNFPANTIQAEQFSLDIFEFPKIDAPYKNFEIRYTTNTTPDDNRFNDTTFFNQQFGTQYAYDDGSSENAWELVGTDAKLAIEFDLAKEDTLKALNIYFPRTETSMLDRAFRIVVWSSLVPEIQLFRSDLYFPVYSIGRDLVTGYELEEELILNGKVYIGFEIANGGSIITGFDNNTNARDLSWINFDGSWVSISYDGSVILRPDFGQTNPYPVGIADEIPGAIDFTVYPVPTDDHLFIEPDRDDLYSFKLIDLSGHIVKSSKGTGLINLPMEDVSAGIYLLEICTEAGHRQVQKIVVN
jgi:hypothetical protein